MNNLEQLFLPYQEALELKKLGFDESCLGKYISYFESMWKEYHLVLEMQLNEEFEDNSNRYLDRGACSAPTYQQALEFFEKKYSFFVDVRTDTTPNEILGFDFTIKSWKFPPMYVDVFRNKREGYNAVIKKLIELANEK